MSARACGIFSPTECTFDVEDFIVPRAHSQNETLDNGISLTCALWCLRPAR